MKKTDSPLKLDLNCRSLYPVKSVKYVGFKIDATINCKQHIDDIVVRLNRTNTLLSTIRNYANIHILRCISFAILGTHINYANLIIDQHLNVVSRIVILPKNN